MPDLNRPAPDFYLSDLAGKLHRLADYRGRIAVLNFWSAECGWSERADRALVECLEEWAGRVALLTIATDDNQTDEALAEAARDRSLPLVLRANCQVREAYDPQTTPHLFVVDVEGILRYRGAFDDVTFGKRVATRTYLKDAVESLLAGRFPDPADTPTFGCAVMPYPVESC